MEIWDLYDKERRKTGKDHIRGEKIPDGSYHLCVHVWIKNTKNEFLISQRAASRPTFPLKWECVGGSVIKGEDSLHGAIRETKEEVGITLSPSSGQLVFSKIRDKIEGEHFNDILDVWLFTYDGKIDLSNATTDEVADTKWMNYSQILKFFETEKMIKNLSYFIETFKGN